MEWTKRELERLLTWRIVEIMCNNGEKEDCWTDRIELIYVRPNEATLRMSHGGNVCVPAKSVETLLRNEDITYRKDYVDFKMRLLPEESEEPAGLTLPAEWKERWWQAFTRLYYDRRLGMYMSLTEADRDIVVARKHLEGEWSLQLKEAPGKEKAEGEPGSEPWLACEENPEVAKAIAAFAENLPDRLFTKREVAAVMAYIVGVAMEQTLKLAGQPKARPTKTED